MSFLSLTDEYRGKRLLIGGHRGHLSDVRENTIANFEEVLDAGVEYIEIDVQLSREGTAVIYHDFDLAERTPLTGRTRDHTVAEMKAAFELNTLDEALAWLRKKRMPALLEVKSREYLDAADRPLLARRIVEALHETDTVDQCVVFGLDHRLLRLVKEREPRVPLALIVPHTPADPVRLMREMDAAIYLTYLENLSEELVGELHAAGFLVDGSVVNTRERLELALRLGVDMVESDRPEALRELYDGIKRGRKASC